MVDQLDTPGVTPDAEAPNGEGAPADGPAPDERHSRWMEQLQAMIDNVASAAAPTMRELAAKAAELAAKAGDAAGPFAHRAASVTTDVGQRVAARGREIATDLRRAADAEGGDAPAAAETGGDAGMPDPTTDTDEAHPV